MKKYRHGDVIINECSGIPDGATKAEGLVLALGEVSGHSHRISEGAAELFKFEDKMYLKVQSEIGKLVHEEHKALEIPSGTYEIIIQREYEPDGWKYVAD